MTKKTIGFFTYDDEELEEIDYNESWITKDNELYILTDLDNRDHYFKKKEKPLQFPVNSIINGIEYVLNEDGHIHTYNSSTGELIDYVNIIEIQEIIRLHDLWKSNKEKMKDARQE